MVYAERSWHHSCFGTARQRRRRVGEGLECRLWVGGIAGVLDRISIAPGSRGEHTQLLHADLRRVGCFLRDLRRCTCKQSAAESRVQPRRRGRSGVPIGALPQREQPWWWGHEASASVRAAKFRTRPADGRRLTPGLSLDSRERRRLVSNMCFTQPISGCYSLAHTGELTGAGICCGVLSPPFSSSDSYACFSSTKLAFTQSGSKPAPTTGGSACAPTDRAPPPPWKCS